MAWRPLVKADGAPARPAPYMHVTWLAEAWRHGGRYVVTWCRPSPAPILAVALGVSITVQRQGACRVWWYVRSA